VSQDFDLARCRSQQAFENLDGGGLSRSVRPEQAKTLADLDFQIESAHRLNFAVVGLA
jgi:hypothetical protein